MSLSASTIHSWRAAGSMFSRLATLRLLPLTRGLTTSAMSRSGRARIRARAIGSALSPRIPDPEHELHRGIILVGERAQVLVQSRFGAVQRLQHRNRRKVGVRPYRRSQAVAAKSAMRREWRRRDSPMRSPAPRRSTQRSSAIRPVAGFAHGQCQDRSRSGKAEPAAPISDAHRFRRECREISANDRIAVRCEA